MLPDSLEIGPIDKFGSPRKEFTFTKDEITGLIKEKFTDEELAEMKGKNSAKKFIYLDREQGQPESARVKVTDTRVEISDNPEVLRPISPSSLNFFAKPKSKSKMEHDLMCLGSPLKSELKNKRVNKENQPPRLSAPMKDWPAQTPKKQRPDQTPMKNRPRLALTPLS